MFVLVESLERFHGTE